MKFNFGYLISKIIRIANRPALRNSKIDKTAKIGSGSNCINITMGKYSYIGKNNSITNTQIGAFCSIASYCAIGGGNHYLNGISTSPVFIKGRNVFNKNFSDLNPTLNQPVKIGNDVWIGENVFINDGIEIGDGAVIGAHSVVTHNVEPYSIVAGVPAKVIRYRFDKDTVEKLLESKWWEMSDNKLMENHENVKSVEKFLELYQKREK